MRSDRSVFKLKKLNAEPLFEGLASGQAASLLGRERFIFDFVPDFPWTWDWKAVALSTIWECRELCGHVTPYNDFPCVNLQVPAFSSRAVNKLRHLLDEAGELLPVTRNGKLYYIFNCLKVVEILDHTKTIGAFTDPNYSPAKGKRSVAASLSHLELNEERLRDNSVFILRELPGQVFVTSEFVQCVIDNGLNGFDFVKAWPNPSKEDFMRQHLKLLKTMRQLPTSMCKKVLVIEFSNWENASNSNKRSVERFKKEVLFILNNIAPHDLIPGRFDSEEQSHLVHSVRLLSSNCQILLKRIEPGLLDLKWPSIIDVFVQERTTESKYKIATYDPGSESQACI